MLSELMVTHCIENREKVRYDKLTRTVRRNAEQINKKR